MKRIIAGIKNHKTAVILLFLIILIYGGHHLIISNLLKNQGIEYHPILVHEDEALFTAPKAQAVFLGDWIVGDFNLYEYKDAPYYLLPFLSPLIMGMLGRITGSIENAFIAGDFIFPAIIFLIFYLLIFEFTRNKIISSLGAVFFIFLPKFLIGFPPFIKYLQAYLITLIFNQNALYFSRVEDPQITMPLYALALYLTYRAINRNRKRTAILAGIAYGAIFYSYLYYWIYFSIGLGFFAFILLTQKKYPEFKNAFYIGLTGVLISLPHWVNAILITKLEQYQDLFARLAPEVGRVFNFVTLPLFSYALHGMLILAITLLFKKNKPVVFAYLISFLIPTYIVYNLQMITGFNVHPDHWFKPALLPVNLSYLVIGFEAARRYGHLVSSRILLLGGILLVSLGLLKIYTTEVFLVQLTIITAIIAYALLFLFHFIYQRFDSKKDTMLRIAAGIAMLLIFSYGIYVQYRYIRLNKNEMLSAEEMQSYRWLTENTEKFSVVATPSFTSNAQLQLYTHNKIFLPNGVNTLASNEEIWERFLLINKIYNVSDETFRSYLTSTTTWGDRSSARDEKGTYFSFKPGLDTKAAYYLFTFLYSDYDSPGSNFKSIVPIAMPAEVVEEKSKLYSQSLKSPTQNLMLPYRIDYLYYGRREQNLSRDPKLSNPKLEKVYEQDGISIYKYK